uniref:RNA-directed RNA polymerase n=1 Tax=Leviviridae sp. TaxID=2027243 RepID=A0A514D811_9VIRU|nr:MAG: RNA-dependent RNA polymerase [Leviviridae sp.]
MGSALCFPMEAMVFTTLIFLGIQRSLNKPLYPRDLKRYVGSVRVYGDDLIVPVDQVPSVVRTLEHFGARVGSDKSFWTGKFRESCGREYFNGHDVSITRVRQAFRHNGLTLKRSNLW